jgi:hypothetical protein
MTNKLILPELPKERGDIVNQDNVDKLLNQINDLNNIVFDFTKEDNINQAKDFKKNANKFIKEFKSFCDPLEEEGKKIAKTRSNIKLTLEKIVEEKLYPLKEREEKIKAIKSKLFIPSSDVYSCKSKLQDLNDLNNYAWLAFEEEATTLITQSKNFLENELIKFEKEEQERIEVEKKAKKEREEQIVKEAEERARREEREKIEKEKQLKEQEESRIKLEEERKKNDIDHKREIHSNILEDISSLDLDINYEQGKSIVKAIVNGKIKHLTIKY